MVRYLEGLMRMLTLFDKKVGISGTLTSLGSVHVKNAIRIHRKLKSRKNISRMADSRRRIQCRLMVVLEKINIDNVMDTQMCKKINSKCILGQPLKNGARPIVKWCDFTMSSVSNLDSPWAVSVAVDMNYLRLEVLQMLTRCRKQLGIRKRCNRKNINIVIDC